MALATPFSGITMVKKLLKTLGLLVAILLLLTGGLVVQVLWFKPFSIAVFYERIFIEFALEDPQMLTSMRLLEQIGLDFHNDDLTDASPAFAQKMAQMARDDLAMLHQYDRAELTPEEQLSYDILDHFLKDTVEGQRFMFHDYPVNQMFGEQSDLPSFMASQHQVNNENDAENYIARLNKFDTKFSQVLAGLKLREERKIIPPRFVVEKVLKEMRGFIEYEVDQNILHVALVDKLEKIPDLAGERRKTLVAAADAAIRDGVYPAYQRLIDYFQELESKTTGNNGVWSLPDGDAYYAYQVRSHTTTTLRPEEVHQLGLSEVERIEQEMDAIMVAQGYVMGSIGERIRAMALEPRFLYLGEENFREQIPRDYQKIIDEIDAGLDAYFDLRPKVGVVVEPVPEFKENTAPGAYYNNPPMDNSRPGIFNVNLRDVSEITKFGMRTLAYHEAIPGHHFQIAIAQDMEGVPMFRRILPFTAYVEGWALYAERLAYEMGFENDPFDNLGRLQAEMFRAVRLVVDTGLHHKRWTRERAVDYMIDKTGMGDGEVVAEIERYLVDPGQALSYKIGMVKILELRERAQQALGDEFDFRAFHNVVLSSGAMPLSLLENQVDRYIARSRL